MFPLGNTLIRPTKELPLAYIVHFLKIVAVSFLSFFEMLVINLFIYFNVGTKEAYAPSEAAKPSPPWKSWGGSCPVVKMIPRPSPWPFPVVVHTKNPWLAMKNPRIVPWISKFQE